MPSSIDPRRAAALGIALAGSWLPGAAAIGKASIDTAQAPARSRIKDFRQA